jgi:death on curing protein
MKQPQWISREVALAIHEQSLALHGGSAGIRDEGLLESALGRPQNLFAYEQRDIYTLAAAYAAGIIRNHPFIDGNKRTGFVVCAVFLERNGYELLASEEEATLTTLALAASQMKEAEYASWLQRNTARPGRER